MPAQAGISQAQRWAMQGVLDFRSGRSGVRYRIEGRGHPPKSVRARFRLAEGQESPLARGTTGGVLRTNETPAAKSAASPLEKGDK